MPKGRLEAFSDAVIAIAITIMVLELKVPEATWDDFRSETLPVLLTYVLSFLYLAIYWNNHHHFLHAVERTNGKILWANMHLLFWLSLVPFATQWMNESDFASLPTAGYGLVLLMAALAWLIFQKSLITEHGADSRLAMALGNDLKGKISATLYMTAIALAFASAWISIGLYVFVALMWLVPDRRIESTLGRAA